MVVRNISAHSADAFILERLVSLQQAQTPVKCALCVAHGV